MILISFDKKILYTNFHASIKIISENGSTKGDFLDPLGIALHRNGDNYISDNGTAVFTRNMPLIKFAKQFSDIKLCAYHVPW